MAPKLQSAPTLPGWDYPKLSAAGNAIAGKTQAEQQMVTTYGNWMAASSELLLPVLEAILQNELIPQFQRNVIQASPQMAQVATARIAEQHTGRPLPFDLQRPQIEAILWRTIVDPVGGASESAQGTLPIVDPQYASDPTYFLRAMTQRNQYAKNYLDRWNTVLMRPFDDRWNGQAKMSNFGRLWRGFTCAQLQQLISEYPDRNVPMMIREGPPTDIPTRNAWLVQNYEFVGVAYRPKMSPAIPRLFSDTLLADNQTFAQGMLFLPRSRPVDVGWWTINGETRWGFIHGELWNQQRYGAPSRSWDMWNQGWTFQLIPAIADSVPAILSQPPQSTYIAVNNQQLPNLANVSQQDILRLTTH